jgi:molybdopterin synthase sulfur carrier subunit
MPNIRIPVPLRKVTGGKSVVRVKGSTAREVLDDLICTYPELKQEILDGESLATSTWESMNLLLGYQDIREIDGWDTRVAPEDKLMLLRTWPAAISGGKQYNQPIGAPPPDEQ